MKIERPATELKAQESTIFKSVYKEYSFMKSQFLSRGYRTVFRTVMVFFVILIMLTSTVGAALAMSATAPNSPDNDPSFRMGDSPNQAMATVPASVCVPVNLVTNGAFDNGASNSTPDNWTTTIGYWGLNTTYHRVENEYDLANNATLAQSVSGLTAGAAANGGFVKLTMDLGSREGDSYAGASTKLDIYLGGVKYATVTNSTATTQNVSIQTLAGASVDPANPFTVFTSDQNTAGDYEPEPGGFTLLIPYSGPDTALLEYKMTVLSNAPGHSAGDDFYLDNINLAGLQCGPACQVKDTITNGNFSSTVPINAPVGWTASPIPSVWPVVALSGNNVAVSSTNNATLSQTVSGLTAIAASNSGKVSLTMDVGVGTGLSGPTDMEIWLGGTKYATVKYAADNSVTIVTSAGATVNASNPFTPFTAGGSFPFEAGGFTLDMPYTGPDSATLMFKLTASGIFLAQFGVDNVHLGGKACFAVSGNVFNDTTNNNDVDGTGTNAGGLYANLVDSNGVVVGIAPVNPDGTYAFGGVDQGTYTVQINTTPGTVGSPPPVQQLPAGWVNTGDEIGTTQGSTADGVSEPFTITAAPVSDINFGINSAPVNTTEAVNDINQTPQGEPVSGNVLTNDSDREGDTQTVTGVLA
ncbi:MAG: hypothetical protein WAZ19_11930, partial [Anaerolineae bacterium]